MITWIEKKYDRMEDLFTRFADSIGDVFGKPPGTVPNGIGAITATLVVGGVAAIIIKLI